MLSIVKGPYLQWPTTEGITVMWETSSQAAGSVTLWETEAVHSGLDGRGRSLPETERSVVAVCDDCVCRARIEGLRPETTYHYRVRVEGTTGEPVQSAEHPLRTAPEEGTPFSFAVTSETGGYGDEETDRRVFAQIRRFRPDFLLMVGDAVQRGLRYEDWERFFFGPGRDLLRSTPFYLCQGNHEDDSPWFYRYVSYPAPKNWYSFDYGNAHFTALDCTALVKYRDKRPVLVAELGPGVPQYDFLVRDLERSRATWKIVFFHYSPYVSGDYEVAEMRALCPALERYGVDLVLNSHTIVYERSHPIREGRLDTEAGIVYVVAGGAGAMPNWLHPFRSWHTAASLAVPHFVQVVVAGPTLELRAYDAEGRLFDVATLRSRR